MCQSRKRTYLFGKSAPMACGEPVLQDSGPKVPEAAATDSQPGLAAPSADAEDCFWRALRVAPKQGARWWELRGAMSLVRVRQGQGHRDAARELLAGMHGFLTEGFATAGRVEVEALLQDLQ